MLVFNSLQELKPYYHERINTYVFDDHVQFNFNVDVDAHIYAYDIYAYYIKSYDINAFNIKSLDIKATNINALNIEANDISASNITALNILYSAMCFSDNNITCNSIQGLIDYPQLFVRDGEIIIKPKQNKEFTLKLMHEQVIKIKSMLGE
jgi:hypothetical protein